MKLHPHLHHRRTARRLGLAFWLNVSAVALWSAMLPITLETGLKASVPFVAAISIYALMVGHLTAALAALAGQASNENRALLNKPPDPPEEAPKPKQRRKPAAKKVPSSDSKAI